MQRITKSRKKRRVQVLWLLRITKNCPKPWSVGTSWSNGWSWSIRAIEQLDMSAIHKPTNDSKYHHRSSCMLTSSQPLTTRTNTSPSCCSVWPCHAFQPSRFNWRSSMNHTRNNEIRSFIEYQLQLQVSVKKYLFDELPFRKHFQGRVRLSLHNRGSFCHVKLTMGK